jgi:hypothetical protein
MTAAILNFFEIHRDIAALHAFSLFVPINCTIVLGSSAVRNILFCKVALTCFAFVPVGPQSVHSRKILNRIVSALTCAIPIFARASVLIKGLPISFRSDRP